MTNRSALVVHKANDSARVQESEAGHGRNIETAAAEQPKKGWEGPGILRENASGY
jgi:hypothetical protein